MLQREQTGSQLLPTPQSFKPQMVSGALPLPLFCAEDKINFHITLISSVSYKLSCLLTKVTTDKPLQLILLAVSRH